MMRARDLIIDFINFILACGLIIFFIIFFLYKDNFKIFMDIMIAVSPLSFFAVIFLLKLKLSRKEFSRRRDHGNLDITLNITFSDKIILDIILFSSPLIILLIPFLDGTPNLIDLLQALTVFAIFYFWEKHLFKGNSL